LTPAPSSHATGREPRCGVQYVQYQYCTEPLVRNLNLKTAVSYPHHQLHHLVSHPSFSLITQSISSTSFDPPTLPHKLPRPRLFPTPPNQQNPTNQPTSRNPNNRNSELFAHNVQLGHPHLLSPFLLLPDFRNDDDDDGSSSSSSSGSTAQEEPTRAHLGSAHRLYGGAPAAPTTSAGTTTTTTTTTATATERSSPGVFAVFDAHADADADGYYAQQQAAALQRRRWRGRAVALAFRELVPRAARSRRVGLSLCRCSLGLREGPDLLLLKRKKKKRTATDCATAATVHPRLHISTQGRALHRK
jgi:hypothetical protein